jgi:hypothetical protein
MTIRKRPREITVRNVDRLLSRYVELVETVGDSVVDLRGIRLLSALKRDAVGSGPYPKVALFEGANRIMTDLVMLRGVRWMLQHKVFPFRSYTVEYGHGNEGAHDSEAGKEGRSLIGEVFNVSRSLFPLKKAAALKKLRASKSNADYRVILVNHDAVAPAYAPKPRPGEYYVFVNIGTGECRLAPVRKAAGG